MQEQYRYLYEMAVEYMESFETYANFKWSLELRLSFCCPLFIILRNICGLSTAFSRLLFDDSKCIFDLQCIFVVHKLVDICDFVLNLVCCCMLLK